MWKQFFLVKKPPNYVQCGDAHVKNKAHKKILVELEHHFFPKKIYLFWLFFLHSHFCLQNQNNLLNYSGH